MTASSELAVECCSKVMVYYVGHIVNTLPAYGWSNLEGQLTVRLGPARHGVHRMVRVTGAVGQKLKGVPADDALLGGEALLAPVAVDGRLAGRIGELAIGATILPIRAAAPVMRSR